MSKYREISGGPEIKEKEKRPETKVILHFLRHQEKEKALPGQANRDIQLTKAGKEAALERSKIEKVNPEVSWAAGSDRVRSGHTALLQMAGEEAGLTSDMNYDQAKAEVEKEISYGEKVATLPELNFMWEGTDGFKQKSYQAYKDGRALEFIANESDELAIKMQDRESLSYSRQAAGYASLIAREMKVGNNFNRIAASKPEEYKKYNNTLERFFGTHQTVSESFYMKVLEKAHGKGAVKEFIEKNESEKGNGNGFGFQEGYNIVINNNQDGQKIILDGIYGFEDMEITPEILLSIIEDAKKLDEKINEQA